MNFWDFSTVVSVAVTKTIASVSSTVASVAMAAPTVSSIVTSMAVVPIGGLGISRSLAVVAVMSIGVRRGIPVSVRAESVRMSIVAISRLGSGGGLGISLSFSLSISGPLAVVVSSVATISSTVTSIPIPTAIVAIAWLGGNNSEEDDGESNQKFHVVRSSFSTRLPM